MLIVLCVKMTFDKIYTIYVVCLTDDGTNYEYKTQANSSRGRCWGWFKKFEDAEDFVLNNRLDIF